MPLTRQCPNARALPAAHRPAGPRPSAHGERSPRSRMVGSDQLSLMGAVEAVHWGSPLIGPTFPYEEWSKIMAPGPSLIRQ